MTGSVDGRELEIVWHSADRYLHLLGDDLGRASDTTKARIGEHRALLDLARAGQVEQFRDAWVAHLDSGEQALQAALAGRRDAFPA